MNPGRGARPDDRNHPAVQAQLPFEHLARKVGASPTPKGMASLAKFRPPMMDQNGYGACTAHALARAIATRLAALGKPLGWVPSPLAIWSDSLLIEAAPGTTAAELGAMNGGVQSVTAMISVGQHGVRPMGPLAPGRYSDVVTGPVAPGLDQLTTAAMRVEVGSYRIDNTDPNWPTKAAIAIDNEIPVYIALEVGADYDAWTPGMPPIDAVESGSSSGHAVCLDEYVTTASGLVFSSPGSYGESYADGGIWLFTERGLVARTFDVYPAEVS